MKQKLLYLVHRLPYPPNKGDKIASFNLLKFLSSRYDIYLGCFVDDKQDWQYVEELKKYCVDYYVAGLNPKIKKIISLQGLLTDEALSLPYYRDKILQKWVDKTVEQEQIESVLVFSGVMAQYVSDKLPLSNHSVLDLVDVDSDKWRLYANDHMWPLSWLYRREADKLLAYETEMATIFDATLFVSEKEADFFKRLVPEVADKVVFRTHGVDSDFFNPNLEYQSPYPDDAIIFVFAGAMDYWPNIEAAIWFAQDIFPKIKEQVSEACFYIVGMNPSNDILKLKELDSVFVTGSVEDIRPYIAAATISVAPLKIARGIQNKVLEAMAMGKPILATKNAFNGIREFEHFSPVIAETVDEMVAGALQLLENKYKQNRARECVLEYYNWDTNLRRVDDLLKHGL